MHYVDFRRVAASKDYITLKPKGICAFFGFMYEYNRSRINGVFRKGRKWRITDLSFNIEQLIEASDYDLFNKVRNRIHCLSSLLPPSNPCNYMFNLRPRGHDQSLPFVKKVLFKNSFIVRAIFKYKQSVSVFFIEYA